MLEEGDGLGVTEEKWRCLILLILCETQTKLKIMLVSLLRAFSGMQIRGESLGPLPLPESLFSSSSEFHPKPTSSAHTFHDDVSSSKCESQETHFNMIPILQSNPAHLICLFKPLASRSVPSLLLLLLL